MFRTISVCHQESSTVHTAIGIGYADCLLANSQQQSVRFAGFSLQNEHHLKPAIPKLQHTTN